MELPDLKGREAILKVHAKKIKLAEDVDFNKIARMASGASGAELANIVNEAALRAVRDGRKRRHPGRPGGEHRGGHRRLSEEERHPHRPREAHRAYHEIGHALVAAKQTHSAPVQKITIVPRTSGALGYTMQVEEGNHYLMTKEELENKIATLTGGRAAEEVVFGSITTGASNDIEQATKLARAMITRYGMSDEFGMVALETVSNQYLGGDTSWPAPPRPRRRSTAGGGAGEAAAREGAEDPHRQPRQAGRAGQVPVRKGDHHRRGVHGKARPAQALRAGSSAC